jgi:hypothetical protein
MKRIVIYINEYLRGCDKRLLGISMAFISLLIFLNYHFSISAYLNKQPFYFAFTAWYFIFLLALTFPYFLQYSFRHSTYRFNRKFILLLLIAPSLFAWKMATNLNFSISSNKIENEYWNQVLYWPAKLLVMTTCLWIIWRFFNKEQPFYGTETKEFKARPYLIMLLIMLPLITAASTQPDFLAMYPKLKNVMSHIQVHEGWKKLLFELSYGSDFVGIELFFRGFLILAFAKWVGKDAILPMALFYCTIHFGKPLGECISSFFGGLILGVVTYHTRTIWGGLLVHLGIAWMMELGGYIGNLYF